jgi:hypothetical protein
MEYTDDRATIGFDKSTYCANTNAINLMIVNALNINGSGGLGDQTNVITSYPAITSAVN